MDIPTRLAETHFLHAARCGDLETLKSSLRSFKIEESRYLGNYSRNQSLYFDHNDVVYKALQIAAQNGHASIVKDLLDLLDPFRNQRHLSLQNQDKTTQENPISIAVKQGHLSVVEAVISHYELSQGMQGITEDWVQQLVEWAVRWGHANIVELILRTLGHQHFVIKLPLHLAAHLSYPRWEALQVLLDYVQQVPAEAYTALLYSEDGLTALHLAAQSGSLDAVMLVLLRTRGRDIRNARSFPELFTPLHMAANSGHAHIVSFLLRPMEINADIDEMPRDCMGRTALHYAAQEGHEAVVEQLLNCCPGMACIADYDGFLPLHMAARGGHPKVIEQLRSYGGINRTVKHSLGVRDCAEDEYLGRGITEYPSYFGKTWRFPRPKMFNALFWRTEGFTPLHFAARYGHKLALKELLRERADLVDVEGTSADLLLKDTEGFLAYDWMKVQSQGEAFMMECARKENYSSQLLNSLEEASFIGKLRSSRRSAIALDIDEEREAMQELLLARETGKPPQIKTRILRWLEDEELGRGRTYWVHEALTGGNTAVLKMILELDGIDLNEMHPDFGSALEFSLDTKKYGAATAILQEPRFVVDDMIMSQISEEGPLTNFRRRPVCNKLHNKTGSDESFKSYLTELVRRGANNVAFLASLLQWVRKRKDLDVESVVNLLLSQPQLKRGLYEERQVYLDCANAVLVGAALIAGVAFQGWLQPPLGYANSPNNEVGYAQVQNPGMRSFWWFNNGAFFFSVATLIAGAKGAVPVVEKTGFVNSVSKVRRAVGVASVLLGLALVCIVGAFTAAGFAVLPQHSVHERRIMHVCFRWGAATCGLVLLWFSRSVWPLVLEILDSLAAQALKYLEAYTPFQNMLNCLLLGPQSGFQYPTNLTCGQCLGIAQHRCRTKLHHQSSCFPEHNYVVKKGHYIGNVRAKRSFWQCMP